MINRAIDQINQLKGDVATISYAFPKKEIVSLEMYEYRDIVSIDQKKLTPFDAVLACFSLGDKQSFFELQDMKPIFQ